MSPEKSERAATPDAAITITAAQLKDIFKTVIEESRKPIVTDQQLKEIEQSQQDRKDQAGILKQLAENVKVQQKYCTHAHGHNGKTAAVYVHLNKSGYMYCQHCQASIFPDKDPETFNRVYAQWFQENES